MPLQREYNTILCSFWTLSHEDQSADVLSNEKRKKKSGRFFGLGKLCWVNLGLNSKGIAMSSCIGQAMHYTVAFPQSREFEIYKCHTLFFERITVEETDVFRHQWHLIVSLGTKKIEFIKGVLSITPQKY